MGDTLEQAKVARNAAHGVFRAQLAQVREDLAARSVGGRIVDRAAEAAGEAVDVAGAHKVIVAGTIAAIGAWFLRSSVIRLIRRWIGSAATER